MPKGHGCDTVLNVHIKPDKLRTKMRAEKTVWCASFLFHLFPNYPSTGTT